MRFEGRVALVTGAASGMGAAIATLLAAQGAAVALVDVADLTATVDGIRAGGGRVLPVAADVGDDGAMRAAVARTEEEFGALHLAVNNAGVPGPSAPVGDLDVAGWLAVLRTNLTGVFLGMAHEIPAMLRAGGGAIVNVSSVYADRGHPNRPGYSAAKHGIRGLTRSATVDHGHQGIRINEVQPGVIDTPVLGQGAPGRLERLMTQIPAGRLGRPDEVAAVVCFLLSGEASYVNGAHVAVDGGFLA